MLGKAIFSPRNYSTAKNRFRVVEVGVRDGLQAEKKFVPTEIKVELIDRLSACGFSTVETTSFVSPKWVPQMADHNEIVARHLRFPGVSYPVLVPNSAGLKNAMATGKVEEIAVFGAASDGFSKKNVNATVEESLKKLLEVTKTALENGIRVRGYVSVVVGCPYDGAVNPEVVARVAETLLDAGCYEVSLGDTIGVGTVKTVSRMLDTVLKHVPADKLAVHFHDTYGQALANVLVSIEKGIRAADSSVAGLGGCPYAKGATGNLATEDLLYFLHGNGFETGVDLNRVVETAKWFNQAAGYEKWSRVGAAILAKNQKI